MWRGFPVITRKLEGFLSSFYFYFNFMAKMYPSRNISVLTITKKRKRESILYLPQSVNLFSLYLSFIGVNIMSWKILWKKIKKVKFCIHKNNIFVKCSKLRRMIFSRLVAPSRLTEPLENWREPCLQWYLRSRARPPYGPTGSAGPSAGTRKLPRIASGSSSLR